jgi:type IV pilus assembly protein PilE
MVTGRSTSGGPDKMSGQSSERGRSQNLTMKPLPQRIRRETHGFTLIELMIAVAIVAIITAIALPSYQASITKSRRAEAMNSFSSVQQAQERWRGNNPAYSTNLTDLGVTSPPLYTLSLAVPNSTSGSISRGYIVTAVGQGRQASDAQCARMAIRLLEGNLRFAGCGTCSSFEDADFAATHPCFNR